MSNLPAVETSGLNVNLQVQPLPNLTLSGGLLYMHNYKITDGPQKGNNLPFTAQYSATASATLVLPLADREIYLRADYRYMDHHLTTDSANAAYLRGCPEIRFLEAQ